MKPKLYTNPQQLLGDKVFAENCRVGAWTALSAADIQRALVPKHAVSVPASKKTSYM